MPSIIIEEFHAGEQGLIIFYTTNMSEEVQELELTKHQAAKLIERTGWVDAVDIYQDTVVIKFETISDTSNHNGEHIQRVYKMNLEWDDYRSWVGEREVRDIVKLYLKDQNQNGIDSKQSGSNQRVD